MHKHQHLKNIQCKALMLEQIDMDKIYHEIKLEPEKRKSWFNVAYTYVAATLQSQKYLLYRKINSFMTSDLLLTIVVCEKKKTHKKTLSLTVILLLHWAVLNTGQMFEIVH